MGMLGVCPNRGKILGLICLPQLLQCYDQPNEIYRELGLSFCSITHTLMQHRKPTVDTSTQMDGCVCWCSRQQSITQSHFPVYMQTHRSAENTFDSPICTIKEKEKKDRFFPQKIMAHILLLFQLQSAIESQGNILNSHLSGMEQSLSLTTATRQLSLTHTSIFVRIFVDTYITAPYPCPCKLIP